MCDARITGSLIRQRRLVPVMLALLVLLPFGAVAQEVSQYRASLVGLAATDAPVTSVGAGYASVALDGRMLFVRGRFGGLSSAARSATIHMVRSADQQSGRSIHNLEIARNTTGEFSGLVNLSRKQIEALEAGRLYLQIASEQEPEGAMRGWILEIELP